MGTSGATPSTNHPPRLQLQDTAQPTETGKTGQIGSGNATRSDGRWLAPVASSSPLAQVKPFALADVVGKFAQGGLAALTPDEFASLASYAERAMIDQPAFIKEQGGKANLLLSLVFTLTAALKAAAQSGALAQYLTSHGLNGDGAARNWQHVVENLPKPPAINEPNLGRIVDVNTANHRLDGVAMPFVAAAKPVPISYYVGGNQVIATDAERAKFERQFTERLGLEPLTGGGFEIVYEQPPLPSTADSEPDGVPQITWPEAPLSAASINFSGDPEEMLREDGMRQAYAAVYQTYGKLNLTWPSDLALPGTNGATDAYELPSMLELAYNQLAVEYMNLGLEPPFMLPTSSAVHDPAAWQAIGATIDPVAFEALRHGSISETYRLSPLPDDEYVTVKVPGFGEIQALQATQNAELAEALLDQRARLTTLEANLNLCQTILDGLPPTNWFQERMAGAPPSLHDIQYSLKAARVALAKGDLAAYYREYHEFQTAVAKFNRNINEFMVALAEADQDVQDFVTTAGTISLAVLVVASVVGTGGAAAPAIMAGAVRVAMIAPVATSIGGAFAHSALTGEKVDFASISMSVALTLVAVRGGPMVSAMMKRLITLPGANQLQAAMLQQIATNLSMGIGFRGVTGLQAAIREAQAEAASKGPLSLDEISELVATHVLASIGDPKALTIDVVIGALGGVGEYRMTRNVAPAPIAAEVPASVPRSAPEAHVSAPHPNPEPLPLGRPTINGRPLRGTPENDNAMPGGHPQQLQATGSDDYVPTLISPGIRPGGNNPAAGQDGPIPILNAVGGGNKPPQNPPPIAPRVTTSPTMPSPGASKGGTMPSPGLPEPRVNLTEVDNQLTQVQERLARVLAAAEQPARPPMGGSTMPSPGQGGNKPVNVEKVDTLLAEVDATLERVLQAAANLKTTMPSPGAPGLAGSIMPSPGQGPVNLTEIQAQMSNAGQRLQPLIQGTPQPAAHTTMPSPGAPGPAGNTMPSPGQGPVNFTDIQAQMSNAGQRLQPLIQGAPQPAAHTTMPSPGAPGPAGSTMPSPGQGPVNLTEIQTRMSNVGQKMQPIIEGATQPPARPAGSTWPSPVQGAPDTIPAGPPRDTPVPDTIPDGQPVNVVSSVPPPPDVTWQPPAVRGSTMPSPDQIDLKDVEALLLRTGVRMQPLIRDAAPLAPQAPGATILPPPFEQAPVAKTILPPRPEAPTQTPPGVTETLAEAKRLAGQAEQRAGRLVEAGSDAVMQTKLKIDALKRTVAELKKMPGGIEANMGEWQETLRMLERVKARLEPLK